VSAALVMRSCVIISTSLPSIPERISSIPGRLPIILLRILPQVGGLLAILLSFLYVPCSNIPPRLKHVLPRLPEVLSGIAP
jgi:hypothetical protein